MTNPSEDLTLDAFLNGRVKATQPRKGYRAGVDPVLLAAAVPARPGQTVLELGCGVGVASMCLAARVPELKIAGLERQQFYAELARRNARENQTPLKVFNGDLSRMPAELRQMSFDHVLANPPYFRRDKSVAADNEGREIALGEDTPLTEWVKAAAKRLAPKGYASFIHRAERLPELLAAFEGRLGSVQVLPLSPRNGREARLVLVRARKDGRAPFRLHAPLVMHEGDAHLSDAEDYTEIFQRCLKDGEALPFPD